MSHLGPSKRSEPWLFSPSKGHALNLAVVRVVVFGLIATTIDLSQLAWIATLPRELIFPPVGSSAILDLLPLTPQTVTALGALLIIASTMATLGLYTRISASLAVLLALFVLLVPQLNGKVDHYHHLLWFGAVLAVSPCGDALSVDRWRSRGNLGLRRPPQSAYHVPLAIIWLIMGLIYFFPGLSKLAISGTEWAFSDNLKLQMYANWYALDGWQPLIRLDRHPFLYRSAAAYVMAFELMFLPLLLHRATRPIAVLLGLGFHVGSGLFMHIWFPTLILCYAAFVDWSWFMSRTTGREPSTTGKSVAGRSPAGTLRPARNGSPTALVAVSILVVAGLGLFGALRVVEGWPFASYPIFAPIREEPVVTRLSVAVTDSESNAESSVTTENLRTRLGGRGYSALIGKLIARSRAEGPSPEIRAFANLALRESGRRFHGDSIRAYLLRVSTVPEDSGRILGRTPVATWSLDHRPSPRDPGR